MTEEKETVNGVEVPSRERIAAAEAVIKELWDCAERLGKKMHIMLSIDYSGDVDWTVFSITRGQSCGEDPTELLRKEFPSDEDKERIERERIQGELLVCENRANELRKELNELCEK